MGTGFMIDAPLRVARYGISSVISLVDDVLIEQTRKFHCQREGEPYQEIAGREEDARARRITAYLNLLDRLVRRQVIALQTSPFEPGSEITRYYELLPEGPLAGEYRAMLAAGDLRERALRQERLRVQTVHVDYLRNEMAKQKVAAVSHPPGYFREFAANVHSGIAYYRGLADCLAAGGQNRFLDQLDILQRELQSLPSAEAG
jgi:hypothetical protein